MGASPRCSRLPSFLCVLPVLPLPLDLPLAAPGVLLPTPPQLYEALSSLGPCRPRDSPGPPSPHPVRALLFLLTLHQMEQPGWAWSRGSSAGGREGRGGRRGLPRSLPVLGVPRLPRHECPRPARASPSPGRPGLPGWHVGPGASARFFAHQTTEHHLSGKAVQVPGGQTMAKAPGSPQPWDATSPEPATRAG